MPKSIGALLPALLIAPLASAFFACADRTIALVEIDHVAEEKVLLDVSENRDVDILFVVDNSRSMAREQSSLGDKFSRVIDTLERHPDGLPSIHIAVVSTDLGGGGDQNICGISGDGGQFQGSACSSLNGPFLSSIVQEDGSRIENFSETMAETFSCMSALGINGCGFEQPLESMRRALSAPQSESFLREHAYLAVVIVTDEDDCSAKDPSVYNSAVQDLDSALGPAKSFRCFEFGVQCDQDGDEVRALGPRSGCVPRDDSEYLYDVDEYVQFLYGLKKSPRQVLVATIAGELSPVQVVPKYDEQQDLDYVALDFSCTREDAEAVPPIRLSAFVNGFAGDNGQETSICEEDLSGALQDIADLINNQAAACFSGNLADTDLAEPGLQPECIVTLSEPGVDDRRIATCDNLATPESSSVLPCFTVTENPTCANTPTGLSPKVYYPEGLLVPIDTTADVRCLAP